MIANLLFKLYGVKLPLFNELFRTFIRRIVSKTEGGVLYSKTLRKIFKHYYNVEIGMYTEGGCFTPGNVEGFTKIGRYCSLAPCLRIITVNHPMETKSTHGFPWHPLYKITKKDLRKWDPLTIGNDVWIGHGAIILPHVTYIADGGVIAAGAVVNKDVPPYAVVVGNPARVVRYRFPQEIIDELLASKWWEKDIEEIIPNIEEYQQPYGELYFEGRGDKDSRREVE